MTPSPSNKRRRTARAELQRVSLFLATADAAATRRQLTEREAQLVAEASKLRDQLRARLTPHKPTGKKYRHDPVEGRKKRDSGRDFGKPAGGIRSVSSGGLPGLGRRQ